MKYRNPKIERFKKIWVTEEVHILLREKKKELVKQGNGKSMTELLDTILKDYFN